MSDIVIVGGGTGGHLFPAMSLAQELYGQGINVSLITDTRCEKYLPQDLKIPIKIFHIGSLRSGLLSKFCVAFRVLFATLQSFKLIYKAKCVVGFGGYTSLPPLIAAKILRVPLVLHEQNSVPGKVTKLFASSAKIIAVNFEDTQIDKKHLDKVSVVGNPIRKTIATTTATASDHLRILVIAGSQGAQKFDELLPEAIKLLVPKQKIRITQQVTDYNKVSERYSDLQEAYPNFEFQISTFFQNMEELYTDCDLVIARSGASTIAELIASAKPAILIPLPTAAQNHQFFNAVSMQNKGACICFKQTNNADQLADQILRLDKNKLEEMSKNLQKMQKNSRKIFADLLIKNL